MDHLRCVVERITYQNPENGYTVLKCKAKGFDDLVTVVGSMPEVHVGSVMTMTGSWKVDAKYGRQFCRISLHVEHALSGCIYLRQAGWHRRILPVPAKLGRDFFIAEGGTPCFYFPGSGAAARRQYEKGRRPIRHLPAQRGKSKTERKN